MKIYKKLATGLSRFLLKKLRELYSRNVYESIDELPVIPNWHQILETGNLSYLEKSKVRYIHKKYPKRIKRFFLKKLWKELQEQQVKKFGFSREFLEVCRKKKEIIKLKEQRIVKGDRSVNAFIKIAEEELKALEQSTKGGSFWELKGALDRAGFQIRPMETSVTEFYTHINTLVKQSKPKINNG